MHAPAPGDSGRPEAPRPLTAVVDDWSLPGSASTRRSAVIRGTPLAAERHARLPIVTPRAGLTEQQLELLFRGSIVFLVIATVPIVAVPFVHGHFAAPAIDLALDTMAGVVSAAVMILAWANFSARRTPVALVPASA